MAKMDLPTVSAIKIPIRKNYPTLCAKNFAKDLWNEGKKCFFYKVKIASRWYLEFSSQYIRN